MNPLRQYEVTHRETGLITIVGNVSGKGHPFQTASRRAGYYYPADCDVHIIPREYEWELPFDEIQLILRRTRR